MVSMTPAEYAAGAADEYTVVDVAPEPRSGGTLCEPGTGERRDRRAWKRRKDPDRLCKRKTGIFLQNRMRYYGYKNTVVLEGATFFNDVKVKNAEDAVSKEEETRVKALGFLKDKRTPDRFNGRVITRNGKITSEEARVIARRRRSSEAGSDNDLAPDDGDPGRAVRQH